MKKHLYDKEDTNAKFVDVTLVKCVCSDQKCNLFALVINGRRVTPTKHSGQWDPVAGWELREGTLLDAMGVPK